MPPPRAQVAHLTMEQAVASLPGVESTGAVNDVMRSVYGPAARWPRATLAVLDRLAKLPTLEAPELLATQPALLNINDTQAAGGRARADVAQPGPVRRWLPVSAVCREPSTVAVLL